MNNNMTFGMEGPIMEGTWYNVQTGDSFTVQNSFFEDNEFIIQTTDGRILKYNQIQNYIKSDKPIDIPKPSNSIEELPQEVVGILEESNYNDLILPEDMAMISGTPNLGNLNQNNNLNSNQGMPPTVTSTQVSNYNIISKALSKRSLPDLQVGIDWENCPLKEMNMLIDLMDVDKEEIIDWYLSQVDLDATTYMIKEVIKDYLTRQLYINDNSKEIATEDIVQPAEVVVEPDKKSKNTKTKTKKK